MHRVPVNCWLVGRAALQESVQLAGNGALEKATDLALALALGDAAAGVGPGRPMVDLAQHHDGVQGPIQLPIPAPIQAMAVDLAGGCLDRGAPGQQGEGGLRGEPAGMGTS
jgi:hypothetical protein